MPKSEIKESDFENLKSLFERDISQQGTKPLKNNVQIAIYVEGAGPALLTKNNGRAEVVKEPSPKPDMSFWIPSESLSQLLATPVKDVGEMGVAILQFMAHPDPKKRMAAKVHIGIFDLVLKGYLGVLPLGGPAVMKYLASKGFTGMGKIKDAISKLKE